MKIKLNFLLHLLIGMFPSSLCFECCLNWPMVSNATATLLALRPLHVRQTTNNLKFCLQNRSDMFLKWMWHHMVIGSLWNETGWRLHVENNIAYIDGGTHVMVGDLDWLTRMSEVINEYRERNLLNIQKVHIVLINSEISLPLSSPKGLPPFTLSEALQTFYIQQLKFNNQQHTVKVYKSLSLPIGITNLVLAGIWKTDSGLLLEKPLTDSIINDFQGRIIDITTDQKPRVFNPRYPNGTAMQNVSETGGYVSGLVKLIESHLNFTFKMMVTRGFGGPLPNGSYSGMIGDVLYKNASLAPLDFSQSLDRVEVIDFSEWFGRDPVIIISKEGAPVIQPFLLLQVFKPNVWLTTVIFLVLSGVILYAIKRHLYHMGRESTRLSFVISVEATFRIFFSQNAGMRLDDNSSRIFICCVMMIAIVIVSLYQGFITSFLAVPRRSETIDSAEDLTNALDHIIPVVRTRTVYANFMMDFKPYEKIAKKILFYEAQYINTWDFFRHVYSKKFCFIDVLSGSGRALQFEKAGQPCRFHVSKNILKTDMDFMIYPKNSVFARHINNVLIHLRESGIIQRMRNMAYSAPCQKAVSTLKLKPLNILQIQSSLYVLVVALAVCVLSFIMELCFFTYSKHN